jgi:hypothetical protein
MLRVTVNVDRSLVRRTTDETKHDPKNGQFTSGGGGGGGSKKPEPSDKDDGKPKGKIGKNGEYQLHPSEAKIFALGDHGLHHTGSGKSMPSKEFDKHIANMRAANELRQKITEHHGDVRVNQDQKNKALRRIMDAEERKKRSSWY